MYASVNYPIFGEMDVTLKVDFSGKGIFTTQRARDWEVINSFESL